MVARSTDSSEQDAAWVPSPPTLTVPTPLANASSATFAFSSANATSYTCALDGAALTGCTSPKTFTGLAQAGHTFGVKALSRTGKASATTSFPGPSTPRPPRFPGGLR